MTAQGIIASCATGSLMVCPPALFGEGAPGENLRPILGQEYFDTTTSPRTAYSWTGAEWIVDAQGSTDVDSVTGTANQITASPTTGDVILSLTGPYAPSSFTSGGILVGGGSGAITAVADVAGGAVLMSGGIGLTPAYNASPIVSGSIGAFGSIQAGTSLAALSGNITATGGNLVTTSVGNGILLNSGTVSGAAPGPLVLNARSGSVTFTG